MQQATSALRVVLRDAGFFFPHRGWTIVGIAFLCLALVVGATGSALPLIYGIVVDEMGWSLTSSALFFTYKNITAAAVMLLIVGPILPRIGLRNMMIAAFTTTSVGMLSFLQVDRLVDLYATAVVLGIGLSTTMVSINLLLSRWFSRNLGFAVGIALSGISIGGALFPPITSWLIGLVGWRMAMAALSILILLVALPLYLWKVEEDPADWEIEQGSPRRSVRPFDKGAKVQPFVGTKRLLRTFSFWRIALAVFAVAAVDTALVQHMPLLVIDAGLGESLATLSLSTMFAFGIFGKLIAGKLYDSYSIRGMRIWYALLALSLLLALPIVGIISLTIFSTMRGLAHGGLIPGPTVLATHWYGPSGMESTLPLLLGAWLIGASVGPLVLAVIVDLTSSYQIGVILLAIVSLSAIGLLSHPPASKE